MREAPNKQVTILVAFVVTALVLLFRLLYLQIIDTDYEAYARRNALYFQTQYPARGVIYDRNGKALVMNQTLYDIMVIPNEVQDVDTMELAQTLNITKEQVEEAFKEVNKHNSGLAKYQFTPFLKRVSTQTYAYFQEKSYKFPGFYSQVRMTRKYMINSAGNLLGYVAEVDKNDLKNNSYYQQGDYIGKSGIEASYEEVLRGKKGVTVFTRDSRNRIQGHYRDGAEDTAAVVGNDLICSIDIDLQSYGEELMKNKVGAIVAIEPSTGEILALISSPSFDPNLLSDQNRATSYKILQSDRFKPLFNRATMSAYPPGSTFKLANALIGLEEGVLTPYTYYGCSGGYHVGRGVKCHFHVSPLDLTHSIMMSCNAYYCYVFRSIVDNKKYGSVVEGFNKWLEYTSSFGFGRKLYTDISGEKAGTMPSTKTYDRIHGIGHWNSLSIISLAIGQGEIGVTPLQLANFFATIANRGYYITPHIVKGIKDSVSVDSTFTKRHYTMVSTKNYEKIIQGMYLAVNGGPGATARAGAKVEGLDICGKTGTAQNPHGRDNAVFACFAPRENPKIAIAVYVENSGFGGTAAAPIASLMIEKYLNGKTEFPYKEAQVKAMNFLNYRK